MCSCVPTYLSEGMQLTLLMLIGESLSLLNEAGHTLIRASHICLNYSSSEQIEQASAYFASLPATPSSPRSSRDAAAASSVD